MMHKPCLLVALLSAAMLVGCQGGSNTYQPKPPPKVEGTTVKEGLDQNLLPLAEGNQWTYVDEVNQIVKGQQRSQTSEVTFKVTKVEKLADGVRATMEVTSDGTLTDRQVWEANSSGIYQVSTGLKNPKVSNPMQPIVLFPATAGRTFTWKGSSVLPDGTEGTNEVDAKILGMQTADTAGDSVMALAIQQTATFKLPKLQGKQDTEIYLAPGIGIARFRQETAFPGNGTIVLLKLKSHSFK